MRIGNTVLVPLLGSLALTAGCIMDNGDGQSRADSPVEAELHGKESYQALFEQPDLHHIDEHLLVSPRPSLVTPDRIHLIMWGLRDAVHMGPALWRMEDYTGLAVPEKEKSSLQRSVSPDSKPASGIQAKNRTVGIVIDSQSIDTHRMDAITPTVIHYDWGNTSIIRPFSDDDTGLVFSLYAQIPHTATEGGGVAQTAIYFSFLDTISGIQFWYGALLYDSRGEESYGERIGIDNCKICTGLPIVQTLPGEDGRYGSAHDGSQRAAVDTWRGFRKFSLYITPANFRAAIQDLAAKHASMGDLSPRPEDYELLHFNVNPEVFAPPGARASVGLSVTGIEIGLLRDHGNVASEPSR